MPRSSDIRNWEKYGDTAQGFVNDGRHDPVLPNASRSTIILTIVCGILFVYASAAFGKALGWFSLY